MKALPTPASGGGPATPGSRPRALADVELDSYVARASVRVSATGPALSAFQRRMEGYPQLDAAEQGRLAAVFQRSRAAQAAAAGRRRPPADLAATIRDGERALEALAGANFKLVLLICREQAETRHGRERANELLPDLVAEANVALTEAAGNFDPARCPEFPKYAARAIRDRVRMTLSRDSSLKLAPSWLRLKRIAAVRIPALTTQLGRPPSTEELQADLLAVCLEWAEGRLTDAQKALTGPARHDAKLARLRKQGMLGAIAQIDEVLIATQSFASLDTPVGEDGGSTLGELLPGHDSGALFDEVELGELRTQLLAALDELPAREREIVLLRFGFVDGETWTYAKIAARHNVTAERIRQLEKGVLARLADPASGTAHLAAFLPSRVDGPADVREAAQA